MLKCTSTRVSLTSSEDQLLGKWQRAGHGRFTVPRLTDSSSSYSLPGTVVLTLPILPLCYEGRYRILHDLTIVFEGKAEYWDESSECAAVRAELPPTRLLGFSSDHRCLHR
jgi:hypothetical protein